MSEVFYKCVVCMWPDTGLYVNSSVDQSGACEAAAQITYATKP